MRPVAPLLQCTSLEVPAVEGSEAERFTGALSMQRLSPKESVGAAGGVVTVTVSVDVEEQ